MSGKSVNSRSKKTDPSILSDSKNKKVKYLRFCIKKKKNQKEAYIFPNQCVQANKGSL